MLITGKPEEVINAQSLVWDNITQQVADDGTSVQQHCVALIALHFFSYIIKHAASALLTLTIFQPLIHSLSLPQALTIFLDPPVALFL